MKKVGEILLLVFFLQCQWVFSLQSDQVSPRSWVMSVLGSMAAKGLSDKPSRIFFSDGTFSRRETAEIVKGLIDKAYKAPWDFADEDLYMLGQLIDEFSWELKVLGMDPKKAKEELELSYYKGIFWGARLAGTTRYEDDGGGSDSRLLYRLPMIIPAGEGFFYLSPSNEKRWLAEKPSDFPFLDSAIMKTHLWDADWEVGRGYVRLGPGYISSIWLGDNPPPYDYLLITKDFKVGSLGWLRMKQFHTTYKSAGIRRYYISRRVEKSIRNWDFAIYEVHLSDKFPSIFAFMPLLPLYGVQHFWENDYDVNMVMGLEVARNYSQGALYGDWFIDDITTYPRHVPRKTAILIGGRREWKDFTFYLEYVYVDRETYTHKNPNNDYLYKGYPMGFLLGPDSKGVFLRFDFHKGFPFILQIGQTTEGRSSSIPTKLSSLRVLFPYDLGTDKSLSLCINPYRREIGGKVERGILWEIRAEYDF